MESLHLQICCSANSIPSVQLGCLWQVPALGNLGLLVFGQIVNSKSWCCLFAWLQFLLYLWSSPCLKHPLLVFCLCLFGVMHIHVCMCTYVFMYVCGACAEAGDPCFMSASLSTSLRRGLSLNPKLLTIVADPWDRPSSTSQHGNQRSGPLCLCFYGDVGDRIQVFVFAYVSNTLLAESLLALILVCFLLHKTDYHRSGNLFLNF